MSKSKDKKTIIEKIIPGFIRHDFWRKLIALLFAIMVYARIEKLITVDGEVSNVPVNIILSEDVMNLNKKDIKLNLRIKATRQIISALSPSDFKINIDFSKLHIASKSGKVVYTIDKRKDIISPPGVQVLQVMPDTITLNLTKMLTKTLPVKIITTGNLMDIYKFQIASVTPDTVRVTGPVDIVRKLDSIKTEAIVLKNKYVSDFETKLYIEEHPDVKYSCDYINVAVNVLKKYKTQLFRNVPIAVFTNKYRNVKIKFSNDLVDITATGLKKDMEVILKEKFHPYVDISNLKAPGKYQLKVKCFTDKQDILIKKITPPKIEVELLKP